ncbi:MAG TPA: hypothetical protein VKA00_01950 [Trueperaceae bacterium]|nr:hypothetical protein [Trueperaceae bacterium]
MTAPDSSSVPGSAWEVTTALQARLLSDPAGRSYFIPFLARTRSVKAAAAEVGCRLDAMHYRVTRFLAAGLLGVVGETPRAGRPIKLYRSVADTFYIPFGLTPYAELEERIRRDLRSEEDRLVAALAHAVRLSGREGRRIYRSDDGEVMVDAAADTAPPSDWFEMVRSWPPHLPVTERVGGELALTHSEAKELLLAFRALTVRHEGRQTDASGERRVYSFHFDLAPREA